MDEMQVFRRNAERLGLCTTFSQKWSDCKSKKQLFDLACNVNSLAYMADMTSRGYGLTPEYLIREFGQFLNGRCIVEADGYSSCIYCSYDKDIEIHTTALLIIDYKGTVYIPENHICEIYLCGSECQISGNGVALVYLYKSSVTNQATAPIIVKRDDSAD